MDIYTKIMGEKQKGLCPFTRQQCNEYCELHVHDSCTISEIMKISDEILSALYDTYNVIEELKNKKGGN